MRRVIGHLLAVTTVTASVGLSALAVSAPAIAGTKAPLFGVSVTSPGNLTQETAEFGRMPVIRYFYPGLPSSHAWSQGVLADSKSAVVVSFNAKPSTILSGADDSALSHFFDTAPSGHPIYYNFIHEPEVVIAHGAFSAASYRAAFTHIIKLANAAHNSDLRSTTMLMAYDVRPSSHRNWRDYVPSGISVLGWDAYPSGSAGHNLQHPQLTPPAQFMGPAIAVSRAAGLPFGFGEFGLNTSKGRPGWLTSVGDYLETSGALYATLFDSPKTTAGRTMKLTDPASIAAWRAVVAKSG